MTHGPHRPFGAVLAGVVLLGVLAACSSGSDDAAQPDPSEPAALAVAPEAPEVGACHDLTYAESVAPTSDAAPVPCTEQHTTETFLVGELDAVVDGHLLAIDSERVREQVSRACPGALAEWLGATEEQMQLSMIRPVWFSPTLEESDEGHSWFRCDAVVIAGQEQLLPLDSSLEGALATEEGRERFGMCSTGQPGTESFNRVVCSSDHSWRAVATTVVPAGDGDAWPGEEAARRAGEEACTSLARDEADDQLNFTWGYEWPTEEQWRAGTRHGTCWLPT